MRIKTLIAIAAAMLALVGCEKREATSVLLITVDSLAPDDLNQPNMLALKKRGVNFTNAFSPSPATLPAIVSLMTGFNPLGHGFVSNENYTLSGEAVTLGEMFQTYNFRTVSEIGSSDLGPDTGIEQGFDKYGFEIEAITQTLFPSVTTRPAEELATDAAGWVKAFGDKPFFMWAHFADLEQTGADKKQALGKIDAAIGKLIHALPGGGKRTLVILTSPSAGSWGARGEEAHGIFLYDTTAHVPLIIAGPGVKSGESNVPASLQDVAPTITSFLRFQIPKGVQGVDLSAALRGGTPTGAKAEWVLETREGYALWGWAPLAALRTDSWKYIRAPKPELYDLKADPGENKNLAAERQEQLKQIETQLADAEKRLKLEKSLAAKVGGRPEPGANLPDSKDVIGALPLLRTGAEAIEARDFAKAISVLQQAQGIDPGNKRLPYMMALAIGGTGDNAQAIALLEDATKRNPGDQYVLAALGEAYLETKAYDKAIVAFEGAIAIEPKMMPVHEHLGYIYSQLSGGQTGEQKIETLKKALTYMINAIRMGDENPHTYFNFGAVSLDLSREMASMPEGGSGEDNSEAAKQLLENAKQAFGIAIEKDPNMADAYFMLGQLYSFDPEKKTDAKALLQKYLELAPAGPKAESAKKLLAQLPK